MSVRDQVKRAYSHGYHDGVAAGGSLDRAKGFYVVPVPPAYLLPKRDARSVVGMVIGWGFVAMVALLVFALGAALIAAALRVVF